MRDASRLAPISALAVLLPQISGVHCSSICRELVPEHRIPALGLLLSSPVLDYVPVFDQNSVLDSQNVRRNPIHWQAEARKSTVNDDKILVGHNQPRFILQRWRDTFDSVKQTVPAGGAMRPVLDIYARPILLDR